MVTTAIRNAQTQVEQQNFEIRKNVLKYDEVLNKQRQVIYAERSRVLEGQDLSDQILEFIDETIQAYVLAATSEGYPEPEAWTKQLATGIAEVLVGERPVFQLMRWVSFDVYREIDRQIQPKNELHAKRYGS